MFEHPERGAAGPVRREGGREVYREGQAFTAVARERDESAG